MNISFSKSAYAIVLAAIAAPSVGAGTTLFLHADGTPSASLSPAAPTAAILANHAPSRDSWPGLFISPGGSGVSETDPVRYQEWISSPGPLTLDGPTMLEFWAAMNDFAAGERGRVNVFLLNCDLTGNNCVEIADGSRDIMDWSAAHGSWSRHAIGFGHVNHTIDADRALAVRLVVGGEADDAMIFAYGAKAYPSRLTDEGKDDSAVDCDFSEWSDATGSEFLIADQGGADDFSSPARLDVTVFGASSNLVDAFHVLMGFDDTSLNHGVLATLIDTDLDSNANFVFLAEVSGSSTNVELYRCDDTATDGCGNAVLHRSYLATQACTAPAPGPWNMDILVEAALPFADIDVMGGPVILTTLASYAASSLLNSPKDSVLGVAAQEFTSGVYYDGSTGFSQLTPGAAAGFVVRRSSDPAQVRAAAPHSSELTSPVDGLSGELSDGQNYYYVVEQNGNLPVALSVQANRSYDTVRLGFNDLDPISAPVDPLVSTVSLDTTSLPADGTQFATITVVPRDADGEPIGTGCDIEVDPVSLAPAVVAGVIDHGNGRYSIRVASTSIGDSIVTILMEGTTLLSQPTVSFTAP